MTDYNEIIERLRAPIMPRHGIERVAADAIERLQREKRCIEDIWQQQQDLAGKYFDEITELRDRIAELKSALKPFADEVNGLWDDEADDEIYDMTVKIGFLRAARAALEKNDD